MVEAGGPLAVPDAAADAADDGAVDAVAPTMANTMADAWRARHHALRQPLNALGLFCEALKMQPLSAAQQPLVAGIADAAVALERQIDEHFASLAGRPAPARQEAPQASGPAIAGPTAKAHPSPACRIVVVDDDQAARTGLVLLLEAWGASVQAFADINALTRWLNGPQAQRPDLLMLDYHLPRPGDGLVALQLVRQAWPTPPVHTFLITGDRQAAMANALSDGSLECLVKPVMPGPLLAVIRRQVGAQFGV